jgi:hypothetical protein
MSSLSQIKMNNKNNNNITNITTTTFTSTYKDMYNTLFLTKSKTKSSFNKTYFENNSQIQDIYECIFCILQHFPKIVNGENKEKINQIMYRLKNMISKVNSHYSQVSIFEDISKYLFHTLLQYTGFNMIIKNVNVNNNEDTQYTKEEMYNLMNETFPVIHCMMLSKNTCIVEFLHKDDAKKMSSILNDKLILEDDDTKTIDVSDFTTLQVEYISSKINTRKNVFDWNTKNTSENYYYYHYNKSVSLQDIIDYSNKMKSES